MFESIRYEEKEEIGFLTISKPEVLNALDAQVLQEIDRVLDQIENEKKVRALILTGEGRAFAAGADISAQSVLDMEGGRQWAWALHRDFPGPRDCPV